MQTSGAYYSNAQHHINPFRVETPGAGHRRGNSVSLFRLVRFPLGAQSSLLRFLGIFDETALFDDRVETLSSSSIKEER